MKTNAKTLRTMVMDNALTLGRLTKDSVGSEDYKILTTLYTNALDALTEWAGKDYTHTSNNSDLDNAFAKAKAILELFAKSLFESGEFKSKTPEEIKMFFEENRDKVTYKGRGNWCEYSDSWQDL